MTIRVLVADDHAPTRADVCAALDADPEFVICAAVQDAPSAVEAAVRELPDVCLLDVRMPGGGNRAAWEIASRLRETKIVMLTVSTVDEDLFAAVRAGAAGYLVKDMDLEGLPNALREVLDGRAAIPGLLMARVLDELRDRDPIRRFPIGTSAATRLTSREWQVVDLMRHDMSTGAIAQRLNLTPATVRSHISSIRRKLEAPDRESVVRMFGGRSGAE
jgi:DNA-binding NarL/FixJ family response regulator